MPVEQSFVGALRSPRGSTSTAASSVLRYGVAILTSAVAAGLVLVAAPTQREYLPVAFFIVPVVISAWYGGLGPGLVATATGAMASLFVLGPSIDAVQPGIASVALRLSLYLAVSIMVSLLGQTLHNETRRLAVKLQEQATELSRRMKDADEARLRAEASDRALRMQSRVLDSMYEGVSVSDEAGIIVYTNPAEDRMFGYARRELIGKHMMELNAYPAEENTAFVEKVMRELRTTGEWSGQWENVRKNGERIVTQAHIAALEYEGRKHWVCARDDATERTKAAARKDFLAEASHILTGSLADANTLTRLARHCIPFLADYASLDLLMDDGEVVYRVATAHQDPEKEEIVRALWSRYPYKAYERVGVPEVIRTGKPQFLREFTDQAVVEFARDADHLSLLRQLGPKSYIAVPLTNRSRTYGAISLVFSDSGRRYTPQDLEVARELAIRTAGAIDNSRLYRQAEVAAERLRVQVAETELARKEAQEANQAKGQFLATMSHELRTPLNAIGGYVDLIEMGIHGPVTDAQAEALRRVKRSAEHLLGLINDILNFARIEAGHVTFDLREVHVAPFLANLEPLVAPQLEAKSLSFSCDPGPPEVTATSDAEKLRQILLNLLSNAIKFTEPGGRIDVTCRSDPEQVEIRVSDTGMGIPAEKFDSIFAPFVQIRRGLTTTHDGTGLGLAISRDLARAMGGDLTVDSIEGRGSTFRLSLPREPGPLRQPSSVWSSVSSQPSP